MRRYFDSSVLIKAIANPEVMFALKDLSLENSFTSRLTQVEVLRTIMKVDPVYIPRAVALLKQIEFIEMTDQIIDDACRYPQSITLKSSDAIQMATAERILDSDDELVTFDKQMAINAERLGLKVRATF